MPPTCSQCRLDFNPRTHEECDMVDDIFKFYHDYISIHALTRSATGLHGARKQYSGISIHALTRSATAIPLNSSISLFISIHALTRSATRHHPHINRVTIDFNPRTHEECDRHQLFLCLRQRYFNPRTHEECDAAIVDAISKSDLFQSTHSRGVRQMIMLDNA